MKAVPIAQYLDQKSRAATAEVSPALTERAMSRAVVASIMRPPR